jgi:Holliday junction resolvase
VRRAAKRDDNEREIIDALENLGASVQQLSGSGIPDLLIGIQGKTILFEVKDGSKPRSERQLTPDQVKWHQDWRGSPVRVVETVDEAIAALSISIQIAIKPGILAP